MMKIPKCVGCNRRSWQKQPHCEFSISCCYCNRNPHGYQEFKTTDNFSPIYIDHRGVKWVGRDNCYDEDLYFAEDCKEKGVSTMGFTLDEIKNKSYYEKHVVINRNFKGIDQKGDFLVCAVANCNHLAVGTVYRGHECVPFCKQHEDRV